MVSGEGRRGAARGEGGGKLFTYVKKVLDL
jgi:hypothetical protein